MFINLLRAEVLQFRIATVVQGRSGTRFGLRVSVALAVRGRHVVGVVLLLRRCRCSGRPRRWGIPGLPRVMVQPRVWFLPGVRSGVIGGVDHVGT